MNSKSPRSGRRKSYSGEELQSLFKPVAPKPELRYSQDSTAINLEELLKSDSPPLDVALADKINLEHAKQKKISSILQQWQKEISSASLTSMPILEGDAENDHNDDECDQNASPCSETESFNTKKCRL